MKEWSKTDTFSELRFDDEMIEIDNFGESNFVEESSLNHYF